LNKGYPAVAQIVVGREVAAFGKLEKATDQERRLLF